MIGYTALRPVVTSYNLDAVINGDIDEFIEQLQLAENAEKMANQV